MENLLAFKGNSTP